jgi:transposase
VSRFRGHLSIGVASARRGVNTPRMRPHYPPGFGAGAVELICSGTKSITELRRDLGVTDQTLRSWLRRADLDAGRPHDGLTSSEREELPRLRAENRTPRMERDLLKKAVFFAKDGDRSR